MKSRDEEGEESLPGLMCYEEPSTVPVVTRNPCSAGVKTVGERTGGSTEEGGDKGG